MKPPVILLLAGLGSAFAANLLITPLLIRVSHRKKWYDKVDHRKIHEGDIPRIGGLGIFLSFIVGGIVIFTLNALLYPGLDVLGPFYAYWPLFAGMLFIHLLGLVDDFVNVRPWIKIAVQVTAAAVVVIFGTPVTDVAVPELGISFSLGPFGYILSLLWIIGMTNAMNLVDGLDGLAGGITAIGAVFIGLIAVLLNNFITAAMALILVGSLVGFLVFNYPPAKLFMGDGGSLFLGFTIATLPFFTNHRAAMTTTLLAAAVTMSAIPILDTASAILRRMRKKEPFYRPDKAHLHHKLLDFGLSGKKILLVIYGVCLFLGASVIISVLFDHPGVLFIVPGSWIGCILFFIFLDRAYRRKIPQ
jgi:UDP-GlcNAc:undecaprenyl-phosphate GlcNAc-1-phosphate transferase